MNNSFTSIATVRRLVRGYTAEQLDQCIIHEINGGHNVCSAGSNTDESLNVLAKASFIRHLVEQGASVQGAFRELGRRMRMLSS